MRTKSMQVPNPTEFRRMTCWQEEVTLQLVKGRSLPTSLKTYGNSFTIDEGLQSSQKEERVESQIGIK